MAALLAYIRAAAAEDIPTTPASWAVVRFTDRWSAVYPLGISQPAVHFRARLVMRHPSFPDRGLFICTGARAILDQLDARIAEDALTWTRTWLTLQALRDDQTTIAQQIRANWPDERYLENGVPVGTLVAHLRRMAGHDDEDGET